MQLYYSVELWNHVLFRNVGNCAGEQPDIVVSVIVIYCKQ